MDNEHAKTALLPTQAGNDAFCDDLPQHNATIAREERDLGADGKEQRIREDASLFLFSFVAFFIAFYAFIF